jgi:hypothetical protein
MKEQEIKRLRVAILKGISDSSKSLINAKVLNNRPVTIMRENKIQLVPATVLTKSII